MAETWWYAYILDIYSVPKLFQKCSQVLTRTEHLFDELHLNQPTLPRWHESLGKISLLNQGELLTDGLTINQDWTE